jgi:uncharacterized protein (TIGR02145 family)
MKSIYYRFLLIVSLLGSFTFYSLPSAGQVLSLQSGSIIEKKIPLGQSQDVQLTDARGNLQWQQSNNGFDWTNWTGKHDISVTVVADYDIFIRCVLREADCSAVYSDVLHLIPYTLPSVTTVSVSDITTTTATVGGYVSDDGNETVTARGICWSTNQNPNTTDNKTEEGTGIGSFSSTLTGLSANSPYYVRAYATNIAGTSYGDQVTFNTLQDVSEPSVTTAGISAITQTTATGGGNVSNDGGATVTAKGVCWSTSLNPTTSDSKTVDGSGTGSFTSSLTGLSENTPYHVRAYATNSTGTAYGDDLQFITAGGGGDGTFEYDGRSYTFKIVGSLRWMTENLAYLPTITPPTENSSSESFYYVYGYEGTSIDEAKATSNYSTYGVLYNWPAALSACPSGWRLPSDAEWEQLISSMGSNAGTSMKSTFGWSQGGNGTNSSGFNALPAGLYNNGGFYAIEESTFYWSSTIIDDFGSWIRQLGYDTATANQMGLQKNMGLSVRCVKD